MHNLDEIAELKRRISKLTEENLKLITQNLTIKTQLKKYEQQNCDSQNISGGKFFIKKP